MEGRDGVGGVVEGSKRDDYFTPKKEGESELAKARKGSVLEFFGNDRAIDVEARAVARQGQLEMAPPTPAGKTWRSVTLVVHDSYLFRFDKKHPDLNKPDQVVWVGGAMVRRDTAFGKPFAFNITCADDTVYTFRAHDGNELEEWLQTLRIATHITTASHLTTSLMCENLQEHCSLLQREVQRLVHDESGKLRALEDQVRVGEDERKEQRGSMEASIAALNERLDKTARHNERMHLAAQRTALTTALATNPCILPPPPQPFPPSLKPRDQRPQWERLLQRGVGASRLTDPCDALSKTVMSGGLWGDNAAEVEESCTGVLGALSLRGSREVRIVVGGSPFGDTLSERHMLLVDAFPYLRLLARQLGLHLTLLDPHSHRGLPFAPRTDAEWWEQMASWAGAGTWLGKPGWDHTSAEVVREIKASAAQSCGLFYVALLGQRFGATMLPTHISNHAMRHVLQKLQHQPSQVDLVREWMMLDTNASAKKGEGEWVLRAPWDVIPYVQAPEGPLQKAGRDMWASVSRMLISALSLGDSSNGSQQGSARELASNGHDEAEEDVEEDEDEGEEDVIGMRPLEQEMWTAIIRSDDAQQRCIVFERELDEIPLGRAEASIFIDTQLAPALSNPDDVDDEFSPEPLVINQRAQDMREGIKWGVKSKLGATRYVTYRCPWNANEGAPVQGPVAGAEMADFLDQFCQAVGDSLLDTASKVPLSLGVLGQEALNSNRVAHSLASRPTHFASLSFTNALAAIEQHMAVLALTDAQSSVPVVVVRGDAGTGKTHVLCKCVQRAKALADDGNTSPVVVTRLIGLSPHHGVSLWHVLWSLVYQIQLAYNTNASNTPPPPFRSLDALQGLLRECLRFSTALRPLVVVLDGVDAIHSGDVGAALLGFMFQVLVGDHPHTLVVLSTSDPAPIEREGVQVVELTNPTRIEATAIVQHWLEVLGRSLPERTSMLQSITQLEAILARWQQTPTMLSLAVAFERSMQWHSFSSPAEYSAVVDPVPELLDLLEKKHSQPLVRAFLGLLHCSACGLAFSELEDLVSAIPEVLSAVARPGALSTRVPTRALLRLRHDLASHLVEQQCGVHMLISIRFQAVRDAVCKRYGLKPRRGAAAGGDAKADTSLNSLLAQYFGNKFGLMFPRTHSLPQPLFLAGHSLVAVNFARPANRSRVGSSAGVEREAAHGAERSLAPHVYAFNERVVAELPFQLAECGNWQGVVDELCRVEMVGACASLVTLAELAAILSEASKHLGQPGLDLAAAAGAEGSQGAARNFACVCDFARFVTTNLAALTHFPQSALQIALNQPDDTYVAAAAQRLVDASPKTNQPLPTPVGSVGDESAISIFPPPNQAPQVLIVHNNKPQAFDCLLWCFTGHSDNVSNVAFSWDGTKVATASFDKTVRIIDAATNKELKCLRKHTESVFGVAFPPCRSHLLASCSEDKTIVLWDIHQGIVEKELIGHEGWVYSVSFSSDAKSLASSSLDETVRVWDIASGNVLRVLKGHLGWIYGCRFSPDGTRIASCADDQTIRVWNAVSGEEERKFAKHWGPVTCVCFSPDGKRLASVSSDKTLRLWDLESGVEEAMIEASTGWLYSCDFSPCGRVVACTSEDKVTRLYSVHTKKEITRLHGHTASVACGKFDPLGKFFVSSGEDKSARMYDLTSAMRSSKETHSALHSSPVTCLTYSEDGLFALSGCEGGDLIVWAVGAGKLMEMRRIKTGEGVVSVAFDPNSSHIAVATNNRNVLLFEISTGRQLLSIPHQSAVLSVRFTSDSNHVVCICSDLGVHRSSLAGTNVASIQLQVEGFTGLCALGNDGMSVVLAVSNGGAHAIKLLNAFSPQYAAGHEILCLALDGKAESLGLSSGGKQLVAGTASGQVTAFDVLTQQVIQRFESKGDLAACGATGTGAYCIAGFRDGTLAVGSRHGNRCAVMRTSSAVTCIGVNASEPSKFGVGLRGGGVNFLELRAV